LYKFPKSWYIQKSNFYSEKNFPSNFSPVGLATRWHVWPFKPRSPPDLSYYLNAPAERCLLLSCLRAMDAAPTFSRAMEPQRSPPNNSPLFTRPLLTPPTLPIMAAMKAPNTVVARHSRPLPPNPVKGHSHYGGATHPFTLRTGAPCPHHHPSPGEWSCRIVPFPLPSSRQAIAARSCR
jgi:hypothetical protein